MGWKKIGAGILKGLKVAENFTPVIGMFGPPGMLIAGSIRIAATIDGPDDVEAFAELAHYIATQLNLGVSEDDRLKATATAKYINRITKNTGEEPERSDVELAYWSALAHAKGKLGVDLIAKS